MLLRQPTGEAEQLRSRAVELGVTDIENGGDVDGEQ